MSFTKKCKICGNEFESESRNTRYCSDKCAKRGAKKAYRSRKMRRINAIRRGDDKEIERVIAESYKIAREIAKLCLIKRCSCTEEGHVCEGELNVHHIDHSVFNNHPSNLQWLCEKAHRELHSREDDCSIIDEVKAYITIRKQAEIRERNLKLRKQSSSDKTPATSIKE